VIFVCHVEIGMISDSDGKRRRDAGQSLGMNQSSNVIASIVLNLKQSFNLYILFQNWAINVGKLNWMPLSKEMSTLRIYEVIHH
jgi:hypothetical protein